VAGAERGVRPTRVLSLVGQYHRLKDERAVFVDLGVLNRLEVEHTALLRPGDVRAWRVGLYATVDSTHQTARQVYMIRHAYHARQICSSTTMTS